MGLDLALAPRQFGGKYERESRPNWHLAFDRISLDRDYDLFAQIGEAGKIRRPEVRTVCRPLPLPEFIKFDWYEDEGIKPRREDPYGDPLTYILSGEFSGINLQSNISAWNKAVIGMMRAIDPETPVVLWWH